MAACLQQLPGLLALASICAAEGMWQPSEHQLLAAAQFVLLAQTRTKTLLPSLPSLADASKAASKGKRPHTIESDEEEDVAPPSKRHSSTKKQVSCFCLRCWQALIHVEHASQGSGTSPALVSMEQLPHAPHARQLPRQRFTLKPGPQ